MKYLIDGAKFHSEKGFFKYIEKEFTNGLNWEPGRNLDAFADILEGGFGKHSEDDQIEIIWTNFKKSEERLKANFIKDVLEILEENEQITFRKFDFGKIN